VIEVCPLAELPPGEVAVVKTGQRRIAVFNADGELHALGDRCSHQEAYLSDGWLEGCEVECPLQGPPSTSAPASCPRIRTTISTDLGRALAG